MATRGKSSRGGSTTRKSESRPAARSDAGYRMTYPSSSYVDRARTEVGHLYDRASTAVRGAVDSARGAVDVYGGIGRALDKVSGR